MAAVLNNGLFVLNPHYSAPPGPNEEETTNTEKEHVTDTQIDRGKRREMCYK